MRQFVCELLHLLGHVVFGLLPALSTACAAETLHSLSGRRYRHLDAGLLPGSLVRQIFKAQRPSCLGTCVARRDALAATALSSDA